MEWLRGTLSVDSRMRTIRIGFPVCWSCVEQVGTPVQVLMCCVRSWIDWNWKQVLYYSSSLSLSTTRSGVSVIAKCKVLQMLQSALFAGIWTPDASKSGGKKGNSQSWGNVASQLLFWGFITVEGYPWNPVSTFIHLHLHTNTPLWVRSLEVVNDHLGKRRPRASTPPGRKGWVTENCSCCVKPTACGHGTWRQVKTLPTFESGGRCSWVSWVTKVARAQHPTQDDKTLNFFNLYGGDVDFCSNTACSGLHIWPQRACWRRGRSGGHWLCCYDVL